MIDDYVSWMFQDYSNNIHEYVCVEKKSHKDETGIEYVTSNCKVTVSEHVNLKITLKHK